MTPIEGELLADPQHGLSVAQLERLAESHLARRYALQATQGPPILIGIKTDPSKPYDAQAAVEELLRLAHLGATLIEAVREDPGTLARHVTATALRTWAIKGRIP